jgi:hypothetical protein
MAPGIAIKKERESSTRLPAGDEPKAPARRKRAVAIPPILLEGDLPPGPVAGGPGQRYALGPVPPPPTLESPEETGELPEAYGTGRLLLAARDPQWLYAHWDLTREQRRQYNGLSADRHLVLRVYVDAISGKPAAEVHVHPESRNWFVHVGQGGTRYVAELGYYAAQNRGWVTVSTSTPTLTPPESLSANTSVQFATIPIEIPFEQLFAVVKEAMREQVPLAEAILQLRAEGHTRLPTPEQIRAREWKPEQERALAELVSMDHVRRVWIGSLEVTELVRRQLAQQISSAVAAQFSVPSGAPGAAAVSSVSSPYGGGVAGKKGFWFTVNAELIIYGATESNATVRIGNRAIQLRPDGTFSYRFALPDGRFEMPIVADSADGEDSRRAGLEFTRRTEYRGDVGAHPQDASLQVPSPTHLA